MALSPGVYVREVPSGSRPIEGVGTAVAAFVGLTERGPVNEPTQVSNWTEFTRNFGGFMNGGGYLPLAVHGYFLNGGGTCYVVRIGGDGATPTAQGELTSATDPALSAYRVTAIEPGTAGSEISVEVAHSEGEGAEGAFTLVVRKGSSVAETFENLSTKRGKQNAVTVVNKQSALIKLEEATTGTALERPASGVVQLGGGSVPVPTRVAPDDYVGNTADRTGFSGLEAVDGVTMICVPDVMAAYQHGMIDLDGVQTVQQAVMEHCEVMGDRVAILDAPPGLNAQQILEWRRDKAGYDSKYAALYWPWIATHNPATGQRVAIPPSGHVAGIWSRNDDTRGVHKAPANEPVRGALQVERQTTSAEQATLNPWGINCIKSFPGRGIRVWGARTLSSDPEWRYLNVRRLFNYIEESILDGTQWVVFEPNDHALWSKMRRTISAFLLNEWRKGALFGLTPQEAFYVKCDEETNPAEGIDAGEVVCEIGIAPVKPAEFVIFQLSQFSGGASLTESA